MARSGSCVGSIALWVIFPGAETGWGKSEGSSIKGPDHLFWLAFRAITSLLLWLVGCRVGFSDLRGQGWEGRWGVASEILRQMQTGLKTWVERRPLPTKDSTQFGAMAPDSLLWPFAGQETVSSRHLRGPGGKTGTVLSLCSSMGFLEAQGPAMWWKGRKKGKGVTLWSALGVPWHASSCFLGITWLNPCNNVRW